MRVRNKTYIVWIKSSDNYVRGQTATHGGMVMTDDSFPSSFVQYGIDSKSPLSTAFLLGAQRYLTMVGVDIIVPFILVRALGMSADVIL